MRATMLRAGLQTPVSVPRCARTGVLASANRYPRTDGAPSVATVRNGVLLSAPTCWALAPSGVDRMRQPGRPVWPVAMKGEDAVSTLVQVGVENGERVSLGALARTIGFIERVIDEVELPRAGTDGNPHGTARGSGSGPRATPLRS